MGFCVFCSDMDSRLVLAGKSATESQFAETLTRNRTLKLPDDVHFKISLIKENDIPDETAIRSYMSFLNTECFGRLLIWSPRLPSTHDIVSQ